MKIYKNNKLNINEIEQLHLNALYGSEEQVLVYNIDNEVIAYGMDDLDKINNVLLDNDYTKNIKRIQYHYNNGIWYFDKNSNIFIFSIKKIIHFDDLTNLILSAFKGEGVETVPSRNYDKIGECLKNNISVPVLIESDYMGDLFFNINGKNIIFGAVARTKKINDRYVYQFVILSKANYNMMNKVFNYENHLCFHRKKSSDIVIGFQDVLKDLDEEYIKNKIINSIIS